MTMNSTLGTMITNSLYLNNIFLEVLSYFGKPNKRLNVSSLVGSIRSVFQITCEYTKKDWKGVKHKYVLSCDLHETPGCRVLFMLTNDRDVPQHCKAIRLTNDDKERDIMWDIISFCELNEIEFK